MQLAVLIYIRAFREADFEPYFDALTQIVPWFFALDQIHYARWIPVHLRDMITLKDVHPTVFAELMKGNFVVKKTERRFSAIAIDQAHEQNNASVKDDGGAVGLTKNPSALRRWMVSVPAVQRFIRLVNYLSKFLQDLSELCERLHRLAHKKAVCHWTHEQEDAFEKIKDAVSKAPVLKYCSESDPTEG